jgi:hypothetical protein
MAQVVAHLPSKCKALSSNLSTAKKEKKEKGREQGGRERGREGGKKNHLIHPKDTSSALWESYFQADSAGC